MDKFQVQWAHFQLNRSERVQIGLQLQRSYAGEPNTWAAQDFGCSEGMIRCYLQYAKLYSATIDNAGQQGITAEDLSKRINAIKMADIGPELRRFKASGKSKVLDPV